MKKLILIGLLIGSTLLADKCDIYQKRVLDNGDRLALLLSNNANAISICLQNSNFKSYIINAYPHCKHKPQMKKYMDGMLNGMIKTLDGKCADFYKSIDKQLNIG